MKVNEIVLGQKIKDMVTGIVGIAFCHLEYMNGCHQIGLKPMALDKDGEPMDTIYLDIEQLEIVGIGITKKLGKVELSGGRKSSKDLPKKRSKL